MSLDPSTPVRRCCGPRHAQVPGTIFSGPTYRIDDRRNHQRNNPVQFFTLVGVRTELLLRHLYWLFNCTYLEDNSLVSSK